VLTLNDTQQITLFTVVSSLPEGTDNCKWYVDYSYGVMKQVFKCNFFFPLFIDSDRRTILSK
jgi:uncharacterized protein YodC (DUF2158 family)